MKKIILFFLSVIVCSGSFAKNIYQQIYDLDESYYGKNFPTANHVSYPREDLSIDISYKVKGYQHFEGSEHTIYTKYILITLGKISKNIIFEDIAYQDNKNYITLCEMSSGNKLLSHTGVFEGISFFEPWIGFNISFYELIKVPDNKVEINKLSEETEMEFNMGNKYWVPQVTEKKPDDGRKFYPFYDEEKTLKRLIDMKLCAPIDSPQKLEENLKNNKEINVNELYLDNQILLYPLDKNNVVIYNNNAFYLEQNKNYTASIYLLNKIIEKYPNREVAYINLGDAYWENGNKKDAVLSYQNYVQKMQSLGKQAKIPQRVLNRIASSPEN